MKIEKVNENQIRCTLTKQDLADRQINLRELAYGSEKAKGLFHDMIQQANYEFGFDVSDNPLIHTANEPIEVPRSPYFLRKYLGNDQPSQRSNTNCKKCNISKHKNDH